MGDLCSKDQDVGKDSDIYQSRIMPMGNEKSNEPSMLEQTIEENKKIQREEKNRSPSPQKNFMEIDSDDDSNDEKLKSIGLMY